MTELENGQDNICKIGCGVAGPSEDNHINTHCSKWVTQGGQEDWWHKGMDRACREQKLRHTCGSSLVQFQVV